MITEMLLRFLLGGALVSLFAAIGSAIKPKTFAGLFGAAPPIALVSLGWTFCSEGRAQVTVLTRSMLIGAAGLLTYALVCTLLVRSPRIWVLPATVLAWLAWFASAAAIVRLFHLA